MSPADLRLRERATIRDAPQRRDGLDLEGALRKFVTDLIRAHRHDPPLIRIFVTRRRTDPGIAALSDEHVALGRRRVMAGLQCCEHEITHDAPRVALDFVHDVLLATVERHASPAARSAAGTRRRAGQDDRCLPEQM